MARVRIHHWFEDGTHTQVEVKVDSNYPDAMAEAVARVRDLWREVCADGDEGGDE